MVINETNFSYLNQNNYQYVNNIRLISVYLCGLGESPYKENDEEFSTLAKHGVLCIRPFLSPWNWMNDQSIQLIDDILSYIIKKYQLDDIPIIVIGASMGGFGALLYSYLTKMNITAVIANSPVTDLTYHLFERKDTFMTLFSAYYYESNFMETLKRRSIINLIDKLKKDVDYHIFFSRKDEEINVEKHCLEFYKMMKEKKYKIEFHESNTKEHCKMDIEGKRKYLDIILKARKNENYKE